MNLSKLLLVSTSLLALTSIFMLSCNKDPIELAPSPPDIIPEKSFYAIVGPNIFTDTVLWAEVNGDVLTIKATENGENEYPRMTLNLPKDITEGAHVLGGTQNESQCFIEFGPLPDQKFESIDTTGFLSIETHFTESKLLRGKFLFTARPVSGNPNIPNIDVWSGRFLITY